MEEMKKNGLSRDEMFDDGQNSYSKLEPKLRPDAPEFDSLSGFDYHSNIHPYAHPLGVSTRPEYVPPAEIPSKVMRMSAMGTGGNVPMQPNVNTHGGGHFPAHGRDPSSQSHSLYVAQARANQMAYMQAHHQHPQHPQHQQQQYVHNSSHGPLSGHGHPYAHMGGHGSGSGGGQGQGMLVSPRGMVSPSPTVGVGKTAMKVPNEMRTSSNRMAADQTYKVMPHPSSGGGSNVGSAKYAIANQGQVPTARGGGDTLRWQPQEMSGALSNDEMDNDNDLDFEHNHSHNHNHNHNHSNNNNAHMVMPGAIMEPLNSGGNRLGKNEHESGEKNMQEQQILPQSKMSSNQGAYSSQGRMRENVNLTSSGYGGGPVMSPSHMYGKQPLQQMPTPLHSRTAMQPHYNNPQQQMMRSPGYEKTKTYEPYSDESQNALTAQAQMQQAMKDNMDMRQYGSWRAQSRGNDIPSPPNTNNAYVGGVSPDPSTLHVNPGALHHGLSPSAADGLSAMPQSGHKSVSRNFGAPKPEDIDPEFTNSSEYVRYQRWELLESAKRWLPGEGTIITWKGFCYVIGVPIHMGMNGHIHLCYRYKLPEREKVSTEKETNGSADSTNINSENKSNHTQNKFTKKDVSTVAAKIVPNTSAFAREIVILRDLQGSENVTTLYDVLESKRTLISILELAKADVYHFFVGREASRHGWSLEKPAVREAFARMVVTNAVQGLKQMHDKGYLHCDLKSLNVLLYIYKHHNAKKQGGVFMKAKLTDFGHSSKGIHRTAEATFGNGMARVGTAGHVAPELFKEGTACDYKIDIWSLGIVMFSMLVPGRLLFGEYTNLESLQKAYDALNKMNPWSNQQRPKWWTDFERLSPEARDLILWMTRFNAEERPTSEQITRHPWFQISMGNLKPGQYRPKLKYVDMLCSSSIAQE